jgi:Flp pilus assembly protein protease CpaA
MMLILISISAVDADIRKIPNSLLISLLLVKAATLLAGLDLTGFINALWGFGAAVLLFVVLSFFKAGIGMGDVKLTAVMGFCLGFIGLCQTVAVMGVCMGIYALVLLITRKGGLKTQAALAPPLSLGMAVTLLFPIAQALVK